MDAWRTAIATSDATSLWVRGYDITALMRLSFTDTIFLLHQGRLPNESERRLLDAILIGVADHGSGAPSCATARLVASGNRQSLSAAVAAGILAIGDEHGGAGSACMELIAEGVERASRESISLEEAARRITAEAKAQKRRLPGFGHRVHTHRSAHRRALRYGARIRRRGQRDRLRDGARKRHPRADSSATDQYRWCARGGPFRYGISCRHSANWCSSSDESPD